MITQNFILTYTVIILNKYIKTLDIKGVNIIILCSNKHKEEITDAYNMRY